MTKGDVEVTRPRLLTLEQVQRDLAISRATLYRILSDGLLRSVSVRGARRVLAESVDEYVDNLLEVSRERQSQ